MTSLKILAFALILSAGLSCANNSINQYGSPVFGTVTDEHPIAQLTSGKISGENRDGIAIFRGIPYGGPCDGENRWKAPTPVQKWEGVRDCTVNGPISMQNSQSISADPSGLGKYFNGGHPELFGCEDEYESENCLVLDVLTPGIDDARRPVLVYIHGGGFATGSGSLVLGADKLSREEDLVIVGVNHRLNIFGYLYLGGLDPEYETSGSVGMQDLVQALQWVRDNITALGGDPAKVTIMGESGGGAKVCNLMSMPSAKGLFRSAIVESGAGAVGNLSKEAAEMQTLRLLDKLGIGRKDWRKLLELDAAEMGVFMPLQQLAEEITWENLPGKVASQGGGLSLEQAEKIVEVYRANNPKGDAPWHTFIKIVSTRGSLGNGAGQLAMARASKDGFAPVYQYFVEYDSESVVSPSLRCAWHTADLPLQFRVVLHPESETLSKAMAHAWASFVRSGNPSTDHLDWRSFTPLNRNVMVFDDELLLKDDPLAPYREAL
ncbi:MAG: carboxylesterase/lipase family protein [Bacteroidales bacterium]|nr:carboxylesterase/lipase family protein [Bacteroidales bacterium]